MNTSSGGEHGDGLARLVEEVTQSGGAERANFQPFVIRLCGALGLPEPDFASEENRLNDYVFERRVDFRHPDGTATPGFIDLYKRGCFILEAKQSAKRAKPADAPELPGLETTHRKGHARRGSGRWDKVMDMARRQAEAYARALPDEHPYPPFLLVLDVGNELQVFADFSGQGRNYTQFPDRQSFRISMHDLLRPEVQDLIRRIWTDPLSLDPARRSAEVTQDVARRLARIARELERRHDPHEVATFLMRCLFTMFAEDAGLLPEQSFLGLLERMRQTPEHFAPALEELWEKMDRGGYAGIINATIRRFNGTLFRDARALPLDADGIAELYAAARRDWRDVEPAIFGTLLENALDPRERGRLGAHYTPRVYVERLVNPTVIQPLREDWDIARQRARELESAGKLKEALNALRAFHHRLCTTRVLDPACGTGNFLYVALEMMKRLEGEVLEAIAALHEEIAGGEQAPLDLAGETVTPAQFFGLELNPRAVPITELVLWIGYLKWQLRTAGPEAITEPILHAYGTIREMDALLAHDGAEPVTDEAGNPVMVWDRITMRENPLVPGQLIPDPEARVPMMRYRKPRPAPWPEVEFIVGNPPFVAGKDMRAEFGDGYAEALWAARPEVPKSADLVMHFWDAAAERLRRKGTKERPNPLRRFGFITTNSITQTFNRRVTERHMSAKDPLGLVYAIPDHPWVKGADKAAVRIAMTVAEAGAREGLLAQVIHESDLDTDTPKVDLATREGHITPRLTIGPDVTKLRPLWANKLLAGKGVVLHGKGFIVTPQKARTLGLGSVPGLERHIRPFRNGRDLAQRPRGVIVIDLFWLTAEEVQRRFPAVYQHVFDNVKPERDVNNMQKRRDYWWVFGDPAASIRDALAGLPRYIATTRTAKHRVFQFLDAEILPESEVIAIALDDPAALAVLSSRLHVHFALETGSRLGMGNDPRYNNSLCFDPFPFPDFTEMPQALRARLDDLGARLDAFRKARIEATPDLTITALYNTLERLREVEAGHGAPLSDKERAAYEAGQVRILAELHDEIDRATLEAYGWSDLAPALIGRVGGTLPSRLKTPDQEAAEEALLGRLVALNARRAADEARGHILWLRPEYQLPRLREKAPRPSAEQVAATLALPADTARARWPADPLEQIRAVREVLRAAEAPLDAEAIAAQFAGGRKRAERVRQILGMMVEIGAAREAGGRIFLAA